jgi:hypothetical protein
VWIPSRVVQWRCLILGFQRADTGQDPELPACKTCGTFKMTPMWQMLPTDFLQDHQVCINLNYAALFLKNQFRMPICQFSIKFSLIEANICFGRTQNAIILL